VVRKIPDYGRHKEQKKKVEMIKKKKIVLLKGSPSAPQ
jgi:hypothetical protein